MAVGFAGTLVILRPGNDIVTFGALLALGSSFIWAGAIITIKQLTRTESSLTVTAWAAVTVGVFSLLPAILVWQWPTWEQGFWLVVIGTLGSIVQLSLARAFSLADTSVVMPFDFLKLVWASLLGVLLFAEIPDIWTWIGGGVIFASSSYIAYRERRRGSPPARPEGRGVA